MKAKIIVETLDLGDCVDGLALVEKKFDSILLATKYVSNNIDEFENKLEYWKNHSMLTLDQVEDFRDIIDIAIEFYNSMKEVQYV